MGEDFDFDSWGAELEHIEKSKLGGYNPLDDNPTISEIKIDVSSVQPTKRVTNLEYLKSFELKSKASGTIKFSYRTYGSVISGFNDLSLNRDKYFNFILKEFIDDNKTVSLNLILYTDDSYLEYICYGNMLLSDLKSVFIDQYKIIDFHDLSFDENKYNEILLKIEEMKLKKDDSEIDKLIKDLNANKKYKYEQALKEYEFELNKSKIDDVFKKCCTLIFDDNWELTRNVDNNHFRPSGSTYNNRLTIYFPEILIKNSKGTEHLIKDFYISLFFDNNFRIFYNIYGRRATYTLEEYEVSYGHSHLSRDNHNWTKMCLGDDTPISNLMCTLASTSNSFSEASLMKLLLLIQGYIGWESLEGGPYVKMQDITSRKGTVQNGFHDQTRENVCSTIKLNLNNIKLVPNSINYSKINNFYKFKINKDLFEESLRSIINLFSDDLTCLKNGNEYFSANVNMREYENKVARANGQILDNITGSTSRQIYFKGRSIIPIVISGISANENSVKCLNPHLLEQIIPVLEKDINNTYLKTKNYEFSRFKESA